MILAELIIAAVVAIFEAQDRHGERGLATRVTSEQAADVLERFPSAFHNPVARTVRLPSTI